MSKRRKTGLEGLFQGIAGILQTVNEIVVRAGDDGSTPIEVHRSGSTGIPGALNAVYGASVRVGPRVAPLRTRPATLRRNARNEAVIDETREPAVDVFDEGDHYLIVAELPGVDERAVQWTVRTDTGVLISAESDDRKYSKTLQLTEAVDADRAVSCYVNGVLELRLWKVFQR